MSMKHAVRFLVIFLSFIFFSVARADDGYHLVDSMSFTEKAPAVVSVPSEPEQAKPAAMPDNYLGRHVQGGTILHGGHAEAVNQGEALFRAEQAAIKAVITECSMASREIVTFKRNVIQKGLHTPIGDSFGYSVDFEVGIAIDDCEEAKHAANKPALRVKLENPQIVKDQVTFEELTRFDLGLSRRPDNLEEAFSRSLRVLSQRVDGVETQQKHAAQKLEDLQLDMEMERMSRPYMGMINANVKVPKPHYSAEKEYSCAQRINYNTRRYANGELSHTEFSINYKKLERECFKNDRPGCVDALDEVEEKFQANLITSSHRDRLESRVRREICDGEQPANGRAKRSTASKK